MSLKIPLKLVVLLILCSFAFTPLISNPTLPISVPIPPITEEKKVESEPFFKLIARENLKSLLFESASGSTIADFVNNDKDFIEVMKEDLQGQLAPKPLAKRTQIFDLLAGFEVKHPLQKTSVLDYKTMVDLELLSGPKSNMAAYVAAALDRTVTEAGKAMLYYKLVTPTADIKVLQQQQAVIKELVENKPLFDELDAQCKQLTIPENAFLSFWGNDMFGGIVQKERNVIIPFFKKLEDRINEQPCVVEFFDKLDHASKILGAYMALKMGKIIIPLWYKKYCGDGLQDGKQCTKCGLIQNGDAQFFENYFPGRDNPWAYMWLPGILYVATKYFAKNDPVACASADGLFIAKDFYNFSSWNRYFKWSFVFRKCLQTKLIHVATYVNKAQSLLVTVKKNQILSHSIPLLTTIEKNLEAQSSEVKHLLKLLSSSTFKGTPSSFNQYTGRVFVTYQKMHALKHELADLLVAVGALDAQLSIARLYKEFEDKPVKFCFPRFITSDFGPAVNAVNFFNPCLDSAKVVSNSLTLGSHFKNKRSVIVTGPNAGGKSTIMKGFVLNILCAQSLGIAPATLLELTPFSTIMSYLNITDDLAAGNSHFKAGVIRARELIEAAAKLKDDEYGIFAADEVFNGTTHNEGQAAAFSLLKKLGLNDRVMVISPTHFPMVSHLEHQTENFVNHRVSVNYNELGNIVYPYKLLPGITQQNVAFKILQEEGFGDEFLSEATRCLQH